MFIMTKWLQRVLEDSPDWSDKFDILSELYIRNLDHIAEQILSQLDPITRRTCAKVSTQWAQMIASSSRSCLRGALTSHMRWSGLQDLPSALEVSGALVAVGFQSGKMIVLHRVTCLRVAMIRAHIGPITAIGLLPISDGLQYSDKSALIATGSHRDMRCCVVRIWNMDRDILKLTASIQIHNDLISALHIQEGGLWTCSLDGTVSFMSISDKGRASEPLRFQPEAAVRGPDQRQLLCLRAFRDLPSSRFVVGGSQGAWVGSLKYRDGALASQRKRSASTVTCTFLKLSIAMTDPVTALDATPGLVMVATSRAAFVCSSGTGDCLNILRYNNPQPGSDDLSTFIPPIICGLQCVPGVRSETRVLLLTCDGNLRIWSSKDDFETCQGQRSVQSLPLQLALSNDDVCFVTTENEELLVLDLSNCFHERLNTAKESKPYIRRCCCGFDLGLKDQTFHVFMSCPSFKLARIALMKTVSSILPGFLDLCSEEKLQVLLYGSESLDYEGCLQIQEAVQLFARAVSKERHGAETGG